MAAEVTAAYEAPFPGRKYKAGAKAWPLLVPVRPDFEAAPEMKRTRSVPSEWNKPALVLFSDKDPVTRGGDRFFRQLIPTAREQPEYVVLGAGHFLQEDKGEHIAQKIIDFVKGNQ